MSARSFAHISAAGEQVDKGDLTRKLWYLLFMSKVNTSDLPSDDAEEARHDALADAEIEAGKFVPHDKVVEWLSSWGKPNEPPCPKPEPR